MFPRKSTRPFAISPAILLLLLATLTATLSIAAGQATYTRHMWTKRPTGHIPRHRGPVQYVILHHTTSPPCFGPQQCFGALRNIQADHLRRRFRDIGYNFLVASDGGVYEGLGAALQGEHAPGYNSRSIGIALIGNFDVMKPSMQALLATQRLIAQLAQTGRLVGHYRLLGHRQTKATACPGGQLYAAIQKWPRWSAKP